VKDYGDKLQCSVVNTDWGVGIIRKKNEDIVRVEYEENYPWETMVTEYASALNVISPEQLIASLG
jgi:hypothetical protein